MDPFDVYKLYLALKLHFTTESYDITKHKGVVRGKRDTFLQRKDLTAIRKLARDFSKKEIIELLVANFVLVTNGAAYLMKIAKIIIKTT